LPSLVSHSVSKRPIWLADAACFVTADDPPHRGVARQTLGVVHVLITCKAAKHGLTQKPNKHVSRVLAATTVRQCCTGELRQAERIVQFAVRQKTRIGRDAGAVEFQLEAAVENEPRTIRFRFTCRVRHDCPRSDDISS